MPEPKIFADACREVADAIEREARKNPYRFASFPWNEMVDPNVIFWVRSYLVGRYKDVFQTEGRVIIAY